MMKIGIVVGVVVVVAILAIAGLFVAGVGPFARSSPSGSGTPGGGGSGATFSQAASATSSSTSGVNGGPWTLAGGTAINIGTSEAVNATVLTHDASSLGCGGTLLSTSSSITAIPSTSATLSSGDSAAWLVLYTNTTGGVLEVADFGGTVTPVLTTAQFGVCGESEKLSLPSSYIDSPAAGADASAVGGGTYATAHSSYYTIYVLTPQVSLTVVGHTTVLPAAWNVELTNCDPGETTSATIDGKAPAQFHAELNATTGAMIGTQNTSSACIVLHSGGPGGSGKPTLSSTIVLPLNFIETNNSNTTTPIVWNNSTFVSFEATQMTLGEFTVSIVNNTTGAAVSTTGISLHFYNSTGLFTGHSDSNYNFGSNTWTSTTPLVGKLQNHDYFEVVSATSLAGDRFVLTATSAAPVTGSISSVLAAYIA